MIAQFAAIGFGAFTLNQLPLLTVSGVIAGSTYYLLASGLVVVYRLTNTMSFAQGGIAVVGAYVFYAGLQPHLPAAVAFVGAMAVSAAVAAVIDALTLRGVRGRRDEATRALAITIGWMLLLPELTFKIWGSSTRVVLDVFPTSAAFTLGGVTVTKSQVGIFATMAVLTVALAGFLRWTSFGLRMRATSANPDAARLLGVPVGRVSLTSWAIAGALGATAGIFASPALSLNALSLNLLIVPAYAVAMVGRLRSLPLAFVGAMLLGIASNILVAAFPSVVGSQALAPFLLIMASLAVLSAMSLRKGQVARA